MDKDAEINPAVAAIQSLLLLISKCDVETLSELRETLKKAINLMTNTGKNVTSVSSGCELFLRFITLTSLDQPNFQECTKVLLERGKLYLEKIKNSRQKIAKLCNPFIKDGDSILVHSYSRVVLKALQEAKAANKRFKVYVTESAPNFSGKQMINALKKSGIYHIMILDSAIGYIMEKVDMILLGAEGVVENGGIINKIGSYTIALVAKTYNKRLYVCVESFKFVRLYPLNQRDIPDHFKYSPDILKNDLCEKSISPTITNNDNYEENGTITHFNNNCFESAHPAVDYTPPQYITLLFTDLGILTPSAVSDELIKLYS
ncbi:translation initiation factor eIF2B subunit alpha-like [Gordionus sp. m RMFG-2023]|uniref:translation initiation factor eIF2B subunit alpha-like n=1 Tax=Gordionus sp. m RMFG-2023 TaxID=3053472 RepID=UPI0031FBBDF3